MYELSWQQFHEDCIVLSKKIQDHGCKYDKLLAIARGGVFVGSMLGYLLDIRNFTTAGIKLYDYTTQHPIVEELSSPDMPLPGSNVLVVDDMVDSGRTLKYIYDKYHAEYKLHIAVLYDKGTGLIRSDFCARMVGDEWIHFPWEPEGK